MYIINTLQLETDYRLDKRIIKDNLYNQKDLGKFTRKS